MPHAHECGFYGCYNPQMGWTEVWSIKKKANGASHFVSIPIGICSFHADQVREKHEAARDDQTTVLTD